MEGYNADVGSGKRINMEMLKGSHFSVYGQREPVFLHQGGVRTFVILVYNLPISDARVEDQPYNRDFPKARFIPCTFLTLVYILVPGGISQSDYYEHLFRAHSYDRTPTTSVLCERLLTY